MERGTKAEVKENIEEGIHIKTRTTKQILKDLDSCLGVDKRTKVVMQMYSDYIKLYKKNKIKIGNFNMILSCNNNYNNIVTIINNLLYKEGIIKNIQYQLLADISMVRNNKLETNVLYVIDDDIFKDYKLQRLIASNPTCVFIVIGNDNNIKMLDNIRNTFTWELEINEPTEKEKITYIKNIIKEHDFQCKVTSAELGAITCYDIESINNFLLGAILRANKKKVNYISKEELNVMEKPTNKEGMQKLNNLVGLENVKQQVQQILNYVQVHQARGTLPMLHMVFKGNPGTGKTEVARIIAEILSDYGILEGNYTEVSRADLVAGYVGQTGIKTQRVIEQALGGVLFIDEAYSLCSSDSYSKECIATLIKAMEDHRDNLCVIMAGYPQDMEELLKSNIGFESRVAFKIDFANYIADELYQIFINMMEQEHFKLDTNCKQLILDYFENEIKVCNNFSNGRCVRNLFEKIKMEQATRIIEQKSKDYDLITSADLTTVIEKIRSKPSRNTIGFTA